MTEASDGQLTVSAERVIDAAGLQALEVAAKAGFDHLKRGYEIRYCKGSYFKVPEVRGHFQHLICPMPTLTSLGIHVRIDLQDEVSLGPNAEYLSDHTLDYHVSADLEQEFREHITVYWPKLAGHKLEPDWAGIRPHLYVNGEFIHDFQIIHETDAGYPGWVNLLGIYSPGLTAALAFGPAIAALWE